jgi:hypothetical protein
MAKSQAEQIACKHGHPFDHANMRITSDGSRECVKCCRAKQARHRRKVGPQPYRDAWRKWDLKKRFGITPEDYDQLLAAQNNCCAICKSPTSKSRISRFHLDHNHVTGKLRGLLCSHCNVALGMAEENPMLLRAMAEYIEKFREA